ncbi:hypothetical protein ACFGVS_29725 [Mucilaginibacter sp. AW1-7]|uniref:hypothetical protein n=1 Tax=Mucilaginibacter sp. AW1-7 TaxID=3349874 RepID=UPI003F7366C5
MKKTAKVIREGDIDTYQTAIQEALDQGFDVKFANAYTNDKSNKYFALLIKEEAKEGSMTFSKK